MSLSVRVERRLSGVECDAWKSSLGRRSSSVTKCEVFTPFKIYPEVCDDCGKPAGEHSGKNTDMLPYKEAVWKFLLEHGGPYNYYAGGPEGASYPNRKEVYDHVKKCGLNFDKISTPVMESREEFNGTLAESHAYVDVVMGYIVCNCGEYPESEYPFYRQDWCVVDISLGELIWRVVKAGESS
jgi:hypothetical protein